MRETGSVGRGRHAARSGDDIAPAIGGPLLRWYGTHARDLPWRRDPRPYSVWVSEMMLQQTRVEVAIPYYERFLERFPTLSALAGARVEEVLALWSGLGYYRRARALHEGARIVLEKHGGEFPRDVDAALEIPGIGRYTAGAILSIAYDLPVAVVDGNVERVLSRLLRLEGNPKSSAVAGALRRIAEVSIPPGRASDFNQALMELGATVCRSTAPRCGSCPLRALCASHRRGDPTEYPRAPAARPTVALYMDALIARRSGRLLLERRKPGELLAGLWLFPLVERADEGDRLELARPKRPAARPPASTGIGAWAASAPGTVPASGPASAREPRFLGEVRHSITFRRIRVRVFLLEVPDGDLSDGAVARGEGPDASGRLWAAPEDLGTRIAVPSLALKIARLLRDSVEGGGGNGETGTVSEVKEP